MTTRRSDVPPGLTLAGYVPGRFKEPVFSAAPRDVRLCRHCGCAMPRSRNSGCSPACSDAIIERARGGEQRRKAHLKGLSREDVALLNGES